MKRIRLFIRSYFGFSRMETNAFILLIPLVLVILFSEPVYRAMTENEQPFNPQRTDSLLAVLDKAELQTKVSAIDTLPLQPFDPNKASQSELVALRLNERLASRVVAYRNKGGRFRKSEDVLKIFGMDSDWYDLARPWMRIKVEPVSLKGSASVTRLKRDKIPDDINTADTVQLMEVYGIGPVLARRIVLFRNRLGGFVSMAQLKEVYGLDSTVVKNISKRFEIKPGFTPQMIAINEVKFERLIEHPYITRRKVQAIIAYRTQHVRFDSVGQLREIQMLDEKWLAKIRAYLTVETKK